MEEATMAARSRKNVLPQEQQPHQEALLPFSTFTLAVADYSDSPQHHQHRHNSLLPWRSSSVSKPSARSCVLLAMAVFFSFILLLSLLSSSSFQGRSQYDASTSSHSHQHVGDSDNDFTLGGLLADNSDRTKCRSRGFIHRLRKKSAYRPSPYLVSKLREYEALHQRCGAGTARFKKSADHLQLHLQLLQLGLDGKNTEEVDGECRYIVWIAHSGLGNRLLSIATAFVYALLTGRVLLLDGRSGLGSLLCEPFPGEASWLLPEDFSPLSTLTLNASSPHRFGLHLQKGTILPQVRHPPDEDKQHLIPSSALTSRPSSLFSFLHLSHHADFYDRLFFCGKEQSSLHQIPWLFLSTNLYLVPSLYIYIPEFREELNRLFPETESVFHHVSRYLFFPTNTVWNWILRFYNAYIAKSAQIVGVQIRSFAFPATVEPHLTNQILACATENKLLPKVLKEEEREPDLLSRNSTAVLVTSLLSGYSQQIMEVYADNPTGTGEVVSVYQPSHEAHQNTQDIKHNMKAWAEMCLLSFSNELITTRSSTFGYVAQGLAGNRPWILTRAENNVVPSPACSQGLSMDPCYHAPPYFNCDADKGDDVTKVLPYVKHCEDVDWGLKLFPMGHA